MPVHPKIICLKRKLIRNTVLGRRNSSFFLESQIWDNRSFSSLTPDLQAILFYCRGPMGMAGLGFGELSSQLCQGESTRQRAACVSQWQTAVVHYILDSVGNALRESQFGSTEGGTQGLMPLQPELADTNIICSSSPSHLLTEGSCWQQELSVASRCSDKMGPSAALPHTAPVTFQWQASPQIQCRIFVCQCRKVEPLLLCDIEEWYGNTNQTLGTH